MVKEGAYISERYAIGSESSLQVARLVLRKAEESHLLVDVRIGSKLLLR